MIWAFQRLAHSPGFTVATLISTLMEHEKFPRDQQEAVVYPGLSGQGAQGIWIAPTQKKRIQATSSSEHERFPGGEHEDAKPTADILDLRFHFSSHATANHIEETARVLKDFLETRQIVKFHRISFIDHTSYVGWTAGRWPNSYRRSKSARTGAAHVEHHFALKSHNAATASFESRLLQLPELKTSDSMSGHAESTTAVAPPSDTFLTWENETMDEKTSLAIHQSPNPANMAHRLISSCVSLLSFVGGGWIVLKEANVTCNQVLRHLTMSSNFHSLSTYFEHMFAALKSSARRTSEHDAPSTKRVAEDSGHIWNHKTCEDKVWRSISTGTGRSVLTSHDNSVSLTASKIVGEIFYSMTSGSLEPSTGDQHTVESTEALLDSFFVGRSVL